MNTLYYRIRPFIPRSVQILVRRQYALLKRPFYRNVWPIDHNAGTPPTNWKGWPDNKKFALILTIDVESQRGLERLPELVEIQKEFGFRSCFNFVGEDYLVPDSLLQSLKDSGFEIGVHGLRHIGNLFRTFGEFSRQAVRINQILKQWGAVGFRCPCMYHNLDWIHHLDIEYDLSTFDTDPFEPQSDGVGSIFPFWVSNPNGGGYVELPYTVPQDFTTFILLGGKNIDLWRHKIDWVVERGGMVLTNNHPDYINFGNSKLASDEYPVSIYRDFLDYISTTYKDQYWHALPRVAARFWRERVQVST